jgi:hypothetical protein
MREAVEHARLLAHTATPSEARHVSDEVVICRSARTAAAP